MLWVATALALLPLRGEVVRGRVLADDGMPLPMSTTVRIHCGEMAAAKIALDEDGWFEFEDASERLKCSLGIDIVAPGYRQSSLSKADLPADPRIPAAVLHRLGKGDGESISVSHLAAPEEATRYYRAAMREMQRGADSDPAAALRRLESAVRIYPGYAQAWFEVGRLRLALGKTASAIRAFGQSVASDPWFVSPYEPLILLLEAEGDVDRAAAACHGLRRINPELPANCLGG